MNIRFSSTKPAPLLQPAPSRANSAHANSTTEPAKETNKEKVLQPKEKVIDMPLYDTETFKKLVKWQLKQLPFRAVLSLPASAVVGTVMGTFKALFSLPLLFVSPIGGTAIILKELTEGIRHPIKTLSRLFYNREGRKHHFITMSQKALKQGDADNLVAALQNLVLVDPKDQISCFLLGQHCLDLYRCQNNRPTYQAAFEKPRMVESARASKIDFSNLAEFAFQSLLRYKPKHISGNIGLSDLYMEQGKHEEAIALLKKAIKKASDKNRYLLIEHLESILAKKREEKQPKTQGSSV